jgi:hypothetical protein
MEFLRLVREFIFGKPKEEVKEDLAILPQSHPHSDRKILTDKNREPLICVLCGNRDNQTNQLNPIYEGQKKTSGGQIFHIRCFREYLKAIEKGAFV